MASWTQADLDALDDAIGKGVLEVEYDDKRVKYRSLDDMLKIRKLMLACLNKGNGISCTILAEPRKGYDSEC